MVEQTRKEDYVYTKKEQFIWRIWMSYFYLRVRWEYLEAIKIGLYGFKRHKEINQSNAI